MRRRGGGQSSGPGARAKIRSERFGDLQAIRRVHVDAFGQTTEADLVGALRGSPGFVSGLSLVAEIHGEVVGHVLFTDVTVRDGGRVHSALALAPMAVARSHQKRGVGTALVEEGLRRATDLGHALIVVVGHADYYSRFGFVPAAGHGIRAPFPDVGDAFMVRFLSSAAEGTVTGLVEYPEAFLDVE